MLMPELSLDSDLAFSTTVESIQQAERALVLVPNNILRSSIITKLDSLGVEVLNAADVEESLDVFTGKDNCALFCREACPYDGPHFGEEENAKMQKCNFCLDRLAENKDPICVGACIMRALDAGPLDEMIAKYGDIKEAEGFTYSDENKPSIIFKPKTK